VDAEVGFDPASGPPSPARQKPALAGLGENSRFVSRRLRAGEFEQVCRRTRQADQERRPSERKLMTRQNAEARLINS